VDHSACRTHARAHKTQGAGSQRARGVDTDEPFWDVLLAPALSRETSFSWAHISQRLLREWEKEAVMGEKIKVAS